MAVACGTTGLRRPSDVSTRVLETTLGGAPDLAASFRMSRVMSDSLYGPIVRCAVAHAANANLAADLAAQADSVDVWIRDDEGTLGGDSMLVVARGVSDFSPARYKQDDGREEWAAGKLLRSGVIEHAPLASGHGTWLYVLPDRSLVLARGRAADAARTHLTTTALAPPPIEAEPASILTAWVSAPLAMKMSFDLAKEVTGVSHAAVSVLPGPDGHASFRFQAESERRAVAIEQRIRDWSVGDVCTTCRAVARFVHVERAGSLLRVDARAPAGELEDLRIAACSGGKTPDHVAAPLPPDFARPPILPPRVAFIGGKDVPISWAPTSTAPGTAALSLATYDERGKLARRLDGSTGAWKLSGDNAVDMTLEHVVAGNRVVVHDTTYAKHDDEAVWVFDAATGKRPFGLVIPARGRLCASATEPLVFVEDEEPSRETMIHTDTGAFEKSARPSWCPERPRKGPCAQPAPSAACLAAGVAPAVRELAPYFVLASGEDGVVLGERSVGGRHVAMAAGFDVANRAVRWSRILPLSSKDVADEGSPRIADVAYGTLLVEIDEWHGKWKLVALDVRTGKTKWEAPLREPVYFAVSPTRVWYMDTEHRPGEKPELVTTLRALDLETGKPGP
jgi:hypothetical protein